MPIRKIFVPLANVGDASQLLENAFALAVHFNAHLTAVDVLPRRTPDIGWSDLSSTMSYAELVQAIEEHQKKACAAIKEKFQAAAKASAVKLDEGPGFKGATGHWIDRSADVVRPIWEFGRLSDLVVVRRPGQYGGLEHEVVTEALFDLHRPTLLVPPKTLHIERGGAIAWNGSLEAATALERAIDLLDRDALVTVIQVGDLRHGALPMKEAIAYLESHGFKARARSVPDQPGSTAESLLKEARTFGAGVLVAGAYTHSRIREVMLGGVTATLIGKAHIPVFLAR